MKFLFAALAALVVASDAKPFPGQTGRKLNKALLRHAVKVDKHGRKLQEEGDDAVFQPTQDYSAQFNTCLSLTTQGDADVMFDDNLISYTKAGKIVGQKSFVIFNWCQTDYCDMDSEDNLYMVDLASYMGALMDYYPTKRTNYCNACADAQEWCQEGQYQVAEEEVEDEAAEEEDAEEGEEEGEGEGEEEDEAEGEEEEEGEGEEEEEGEGEEEEEGEGDEERRLKRRRKLSKKSRKLAAAEEAVDCDICASMDCFVENGNDDANQDAEADQYGVEDISEWAQNFLGCVDTGAVYGDYEMYASFICNSDGSGVEIGVFLDEDCSTFTTLKSYKSIAAEEDQAYLYKSSNVVTFPFTESISCQALPEYVSPEPADEEEEAEEEEQEEEQEGEVSEFCQNLAAGDMLLPVNDCDEDGQEDEAEDEVEEDEDNNYDWYTYVLSEENAEDANAICQIVQTMQGEYTTVYKASGDNIFDYSSKNSEFGYVDTSSGGGRGWIIGLFLIVACAVVGFVVSKTLQPSDSKKTPLVNSNGAMA